MKIPEYPPGTAFYTSSQQIADFLFQELRANAAVYSIDDGWECESGASCIYIFEKSGMQNKIIDLNFTCPDQYVYLDANLYFCPFEAMKEFPQELLESETTHFH